jgi:ABC-type phosphate transport system substrate-binding protein
MTSRILFLWSAYVTLQSAAAVAAESEQTRLHPSVTIVVNLQGSDENITTSDLAAIYLGRKSSWESGRRIAPALPAERDSLTQSFIRDVLQKSANQYRSYWKRRLFSGGGGLPKTLRSTAEMLEYVERTPGAIGIIAASAETEGSLVRVVEVTE